MFGSKRGGMGIGLKALGGALALAGLCACQTLMGASSGRDVGPGGEGLEVIAPIKAPFPMAQLQRPEFPRRSVSVAECGAVADGTTKNTKAFAEAIAKLAAQGGGHVIVPAGKWLTGPIHLKSNIDLHLNEGAEIIFSDKFEDYLPPVFVRVGGIECYNYSPLVYAKDCENVAITGPGTLNGNSKAWWGWQKKQTPNLFRYGAQNVPVEERVFGTVEDAVRPSFVSFVNCKNVLWEGFTVLSGPNWTLHPIYCENIIMRRVNVNTDGPNNDGCDPDSCRNMLVEYCTFSTGDDCLVLKSGYNEDGWRVGKPTENVVMRNSSSKRGHGGLVIGSEMSGDVRNVYMTDCEFEGTDRAVRIKSQPGRGGVVENVWAENLKVKNLTREVVIMNMDYNSDRNRKMSTKQPVFRHVYIKNVEATGCPTAVLITGTEESPIEDVHFENMNIESKQGVVVSNAQGLMFDKVLINAASGTAYELTNASNVRIYNAKAAPGTKTYVSVKGAKSKDIEVVGLDAEGVQHKVQASEGATVGAALFK